LRNKDLSDAKYRPHVPVEKEREEEGSDERWPVFEDMFW